MINNEVVKMLGWEWWQNKWQMAKTVDLHPGKAACLAPDVWTLAFWWHDRRLAALCAAAGHLDPSQTQAEWEWALAIAWGSPDGPLWLSVLQSGSLSVGKTQWKKNNDQRQSLNTAEGDYAKRKLDGYCSTYITFRVSEQYSSILMSHLKLAVWTNKA